MIKLYDENSYMTEFTATVTACTAHPCGYSVQLDRTCFFPTAGGQDCDGGTLDGERVLRVEIEDDIIYHITKNPLKVGDTVCGKIDWDARFRKMQHHTAEHIVSGLANSLYGAENVGFHLGEADVTIDYDRELSKDEILCLERAANAAVQKNIAVTAEYPAAAELEKMQYRSKLELENNVRIVTIPGVDVCACCAPHVKHTGEIGVIKLKDSMRHRGGVRLKMICANDALADYEQKCKNALEISNLLSVKQEEIAIGTSRIFAELEEVKQKCAEYLKQLALYKAREIPQTDGIYCIFDDLTDIDAMRILANEAKTKCGTVAVFSGNDKIGYKYVIASVKKDTAEILQEIKTRLHGNGGGNKEMIQGFVKSTRADISAVFI